ncbi:MAG TPA: HNH endonuclease, partial [Phycisphaerae bacterium]|nr:HNH endonuclease [Phycisphaerae bacterium]
MKKQQNSEKLHGWNQTRRLPKCVGGLKMSYESKMLGQFAMPTQAEVEQALLRALLKHGGVIKEFGSRQEIVDEIANEFGLNERQRSAFLETIYHKENRVKKSLLWHRLLFRAADALARNNLVTRPTQTLQLTKKREWLLTEKGFDAALKLCKIPIARKEFLPTKSFEVQKIVKKLNESHRTEDYNPFDKNKKITKTTRESALRTRGFRQAVIEAYSCKCAVCGLKINSPDTLSWEVEAAHIVPHRCKGRDDIFNGIALCRIHHWAFDIGWFTLLDDYRIQASPQLSHLPMDFGKVEGYDFLRAFANKSEEI